MTTRELDTVAESRVRDAGAVPAFKGYQGYPATLCASINEAVVHGIPSDRPLAEGDIVSLDMGVVLDGYYGDAAITVGVGVIAEETGRLLRVTEEALEHAIERVQVGGRVSDLGHAVQAHVEVNGFSVVREFVGHGIGTELHEEPQNPKLRRARARATAERGDGSGDRADGQHGQAGCAGARRRVGLRSPATVASRRTSSIRWR